MKKKLIIISTTGILFILGVIFLIVRWSQSTENSTLTDNKTITIGDVNFEMVYVEGGTFKMGAQSKDSSSANYDKDALNIVGPVHEVTLTDYYIGKYEVTVSLFSKFIESTNYQTDADKEGSSYIWDGSEWKQTNNVNWRCDVNGNIRNSSEYNQPVIHISWNDAEAFCKWLSQETGHRFRFPTEAEWEFAARGGNKSKGYKYSGSNNLDSVAWYDGNSDNKTHSVGSKAPNELGIYDMNGNVWEFCQDWCGSYNSDNQINPTGNLSGSLRVLRGSSWFNYAKNCSISCRSGGILAEHRSHIGFRLALDQ